jgi:hypothetical protein
MIARVLWRAVYPDLAASPIVSSAEQGPPNMAGFGADLKSPPVILEDPLDCFLDFLVLVSGRTSSVA